MKEVIYVNTGEVKSGDAGILLNSGAIGSCVVITAYDFENRIGAMAHVMLPGSTPEGKNLKNTKYAVNAINELLTLMKKDDGKVCQLETCIIGGANVLKRPNDTIAKSNIDSVEKWLDEKSINVCAKAIGGFERRTVLFDIEKGSIFFTVGDSKPKPLWQTTSKPK
ncbi:chemotaxis protein CheD [Draconibacterium halophilum]|uniref:Chemotaxis protein CheD n=1 Tax=Draconibacterium halophilum TaxID=2706887 RepID=A0A6C0RAY8_9BACT|nr:chemotaxis protein CheD [Draconibacterium halophilum]QIA07112.1 chemotaxis protein CheD [Draconibacterium halophilum]